MMFRVSSAIVATALLATSGCTRIRDSQGYLVDEQLLASVQPGVDTRESVAKTLGRPTFVGQFGDDRWYYVSRLTTQLAFLSPRPNKQSILVVSFDPKGSVSKVERRGLERVVDVNPVRDKTATKGRKTGLFEDLFGGIGTFSGAPAGGGDAPNGGGRP